MRSPDWNTVQPLNLRDELVLQDDNSVRLNTGDEILELRFLEIEGNVALRLSSVPHQRVEYGMLVLDAPILKPEIVTSDQGVELCVRDCTVRLGFNPFTIDVERSGEAHALKSPTDSHFERVHRLPPLSKTDEGWLLSLNLSSNQSVFGLGEKWGKLDKRGQIIRSYNHDALGVNAEVSYKNTPFCWTHEGWGVFVHTPAPVTHAVGYAPWSQRSYVLLVEDDCLDVFFFLTNASSEKHNAGADILSQYTALTGRAPVPPLWSTGVILSKAYYKTSEEILEVAREVRERHMPCDVITFDGRAWQDTQTRFSFEWDATRYPDPKPVIDELKALNFKICVWEYPLVSTQHPWFNEFASKGWLLTDRRTGEAYEYEWDQQAFGSVLTPLPNSGIVDFTHPDAYIFWRDAHKPLFEMGVDMIKADFGEQLEDDNMLASNGESGRALHNVYAHLYNRCVYEAAELYSPSGPFLFSRASWIGCQRFNSQWGGDPQADWEGMISNIRGGLSWGMSGAPFYATDVGGFYKDRRDDTLYVRWAQVGIFSAHFRLHGIGAREPWSYSEAADAAGSRAVRLRYRLQAYLYKSMTQASKTGLPVQRSMALALPAEKQAWAFENQFMCGDDLLVVPCFDPDGWVEFYLPDGHWYPFEPDVDHSHDVLLGQKVYRRQLALDEIAVFARSGTRIELSPDREFTGDEQQPAVEKTWIATSKN